MRTDTTNPYVGLRPFDVDESILFFGRNDQTLELLQRLHQHHFVAVVGSSGSGKSSLLRAGLIPALKAGYLVDDSDHWAIAIMKPGQSPIYNLADSILNQINPDTNANEVSVLVEQINEEGADAILNLIAPFRKDKNVNFFLLVDQFEELFRFAVDQKNIAKKDEAIDFVNIMLELSKQSNIPFYVVITMRSDFIGDCSQFSGLPESMNKSQYLVPKLNRVEMKTAIEGPARLYGGKLNPSLTSRLLNELGKVKDELPLLQHALMRMWDFEMNVNKSGELDMEDYHSIGGIEKALNNHADEAMKGMSKDEIETTKKLFQNLTTIDENGRKIRRMMRLSQLMELTGASKEEVLKIINRFIEDKRSFIVINNSGVEDDPLIDISHESLIRQWETLSNWVDEEGESAKNYLRLVESAGLHSENKKDFLSGSELQIAIKWYNEFKPEPVWAKKYNNNFEEGFNYLQESEKEWKDSEKRKKATKRKTLIAIASFTILVIVGLVLIIGRLSKANDEATLAKNTAKKLLVDTYWNNVKNKTAENDYTYALANASEAIRNSSDTVIVKKILTDIEHEWPLVTLKNIFSDQSQIVAATFSAKDSTVIVTASSDLIIRKWNAKTGEKIGEDIPLIDKKEKNSIKNADNERVISFTPDGEKIITTGPKNSAPQDTLTSFGEAGEKNDKSDSLSYLHLSYVKDGKDDSVLKRFKPIRYYYESPPVFNRDGTKLISYVPYDPDLYSEDYNTLSFHFYNLDGKFSGTKQPITIKHKLKSNTQQDYYYYYSGHKISNLVLNRDGKKFLFLLDNNRLFLGNTDKKTIQELQLELHEYQNNGKKKYYGAILNRVAFTSEENLIITASKDSTVRLWNLETKQAGPPLKHQNPVQLAFLIPGTNKIFTRDEEGSTYIWDRSSPYEPLGHAIKLDPSTPRIKFRSDGKQILVVENNTVFLWDLLQNDYSDNNGLMTDNLENSVYSPDLKKIAIVRSVNNALILRLLNSETKSQIGSDIKCGIKLTNKDLLYAIRDGWKVFSPDSKKLLTSINDTTMLLWDTETGKQIGATIPCKRGNPVEPGAQGLVFPLFNSNSKTFLTRIDSATLQLINTQTGMQIGKNIPFDASIQDPKIRIFSQAIILGPDSSKILFHKFFIEMVSTDYRDWTWPLVSSTKLWDVENGKTIGDSINKKILSKKDVVFEVDNEYRAQQAEVMIYNSYKKPPAFSPDGKTFITFFKFDSTCQIWDVATGKKNGHEVKYNSRWFPILSPDGKSILAAINDSTVQFFDEVTGSLRGDSIKIKHSSDEIAPIISIDGKRIITFQKNGAIQLINAITGIEIIKGADYKHQNNFILPIFSPDGKRFLTTDQTGFMRLWDAETGKQKGPAMKYQKYKIKEMAFSPDSKGRKILTKIYSENTESGNYYEDNAQIIVIWDAETYKQIGDGFLTDPGSKTKFGFDGKLVWIENYYPEQKWNFINTETGDLDISAHLLELQVLMASGYEFDFETNEKIPLTPEDFRKKKLEYNSLAMEHYKICRYQEYNFWKRFNEDSAKIIRPEKAGEKSKIRTDQFNILPALQKGDKAYPENNGDFLEPNQAIYSNNKKYLLAYQADGNLVIYRKEGMVPVWASNTIGYPAYRTVMQYDGNLVIYAYKPGTQAGNNEIWSSDTWKDNAGATLKLEDDGNLVIYNTKNEVVWQSNPGSEMRKSLK